MEQQLAITLGERQMTILACYVSCLRALGPWF